MTSTLNGQRKTQKKTSLLQASLAVFMLATVSFAPSTAQAQCEDPMTATQEMFGLVQDDIDHLNNFINQEWNFTDEKLSNTAAEEVTTRFEQFEDNLFTWLNDWFENRYLPAAKDMTKELAAMQIDQSRTLGSMMDASSMNEMTDEMREKEIEATRRYRPAAQTCQLDTAARSQTNAYRMSRAVNRGFAKDQQNHGLNVAGTPAGTSRAADTKALWDQYVADFCDPARGDQGCGVAPGTPGTMPGKHADLAGLLWGEKQTIDMVNPDTQRLVSAVQRFLINPLSTDLVPAGAVSSGEGQRSILMRRARQARLNTVNNAVGQMIAERVGGSGSTTTQAMMTAGGKTAATASANPSYREIQESMTRARYYNPDYIVRIVDEPEVVLREQGAVNAIRLQQLNDLYHRQEEMVFMEAASYANRLDKRQPASGVQNAPSK